MDLLLVSYAICPYVHRAAITLREKGVHYEIKFVDLKNKPDWFLAISPRGKVPVLVADGVPLFESAAIVEFLDETHPPHLVPRDPYDRARRRAWVEVANDLFAAQYRAFYAKKEDDLEPAIAALAPVLTRYDDALRDGFVVEGAFGLVEIAVAPALFRFALVERRTGVKFLDAFPRVRDWSLGIADRPSVRAAAPDDFAQHQLASFVRNGSVLAERFRTQA
jgi:glutathione S-transferase